MIRGGEKVLGASVLGFNDAHAKVSTFVQKLKKVQRNFKCVNILLAFTSLPALYFVSTDIKQCYDRIIQDKLFPIVEKVVSENDSVYVLQRYGSVHVDGSLIRKRTKTQVFDAYPYPQFPKEVKQIAKKARNTIFMDNVLIRGSRLTHLKLGNLRHAREKRDNGAVETTYLPKFSKDWR